MCTMVSIFVSAAADLDALEAWSDDCGVRRRRWPDPQPARDIVVLGTAGMCDCGVTIGSAPPARRARGHEERTVRELRKRGWSEAKIARSLAQGTEARQRREDRKQAMAVARVEEWVTFLKGAPTHARVRAIGLFYREDGRMLSAKFLKDARRERIALGTLEPLTLARLDEGVLYEFAAGG
jgi:hypothetical protein